MKYEEVKNKIYPRLRSNIERACLDVDGVVYVPFNDLLITFYIPARLNDDDSLFSAILKWGMLDEWNITVDDLLDIAVKNVSGYANIIDMNKMLDVDVPGIIMPPMWIVTNKSMVYGASAILSDSVLNNVSEKLGLPFIILPSSIHEVICIPDDGEYTGLSDMIADINCNEVDEADRLSDHAYRYDGATITAIE